MPTNAVAISTGYDIVIQKNVRDFLIVVMD
jgi:hypothetical protein